MNTGVARGEELRTTLHHSSPLFTFGLRTELNRKLALFGWEAENLFFMSHRFTQIYTDFPVSGSGKRLRVYTLHNSKKAVTAD